MSSYIWSNDKWPMQLFYILMLQLVSLQIESQNVVAIEK